MKKLLVNCLVSLSIVFILFSCNSSLQTGNELSQNQVDYIKKLGLLSENEEIIFFDSQGGYKTSGNFLSDKRLATYWIDKKFPDESTIEFAFFDNIDSIKLIDKTTAVTLASYIEVYVNDSSNFKVYLDCGKDELLKFYDKSLSFVE